VRRILVTGATGFVGAAVVPALLAAGWEVRAAVRAASDAARLPAGAEPAPTGELSPDTDWTAALEGVAAVVHLAARAHRPRDGAAQAGEYRRVNALATGALGKAAAAAGASLVFLSSVKAVGESTPPGRPWDEDAPCAPEDAYGASKLEAERLLAATPGLSWCALRAPLVYGPGVKANFLRLLGAAAAGWPLPLASIRNRRSLLYSANLASAVAAAAAVPPPPGAYFVRDGEDLSTPELFRRLAAALGRPARLFPFPPALLPGGAGRRLREDLAVDDRRLRAALGWKPPFSVDQGLAATAAWHHGRTA
jgi:nucleoside-diphosphate-sugar epimerase